MSSPAPKRLEPFAVPGGLRGTLARLALPDLLHELQSAGATGILSLTSGGAKKALYFKGGHVVFAASNLPSDRLGEVLLREGKITPEQNESSVRALSQGRRQGRVLVEMGALSPDELWWAVQTQVREIVFSVFQWDEGQFHFEESVLPEKEKITVDLDVTALVLEGVRRMDPGGAVRTRLPDAYLVVERGETPEEELLHPWEVHVLSLVDGEKSVLEICHESEVGEGQTQKALYAFLITGIVRGRGRKVRALDQDFVPEDTALAVLDSFNRMYRQVLAYMVKEVGPIAENVLAKYLGTVRESRPEVLHGVLLRKDGSLDEAAVELNLGRLAEDQRRTMLVDALNELLYADLLAVKRTLGADHESAIVRDLRPPR
ncbi:MAG TPA: DUF4388 domain-containing protein [Vicinamibacteria bacterium]|nr:DUF4388 domain-containing protein [Vicinamibacteria bacterium]